MPSLAVAWGSDPSRPSGKTGVVLGRDPGGRFTVLPDPPATVVMPASGGTPAETLAGSGGTGRVAAADGSTIPITVESVCVHGDSPGAVQIANAVRDRLTADGIEIKAFV